PARRGPGEAEDSARPRGGVVREQGGRRREHGERALAVVRGGDRAQARGGQRGAPGAWRVRPEARGRAAPAASRRGLLEVPRLGAKAFEQCAGFLRVRGGEEPLDASAVHPESYAVVEAMARRLKAPVSDLVGNAALVRGLDAKEFV